MPENTTTSPVDWDSPTWGRNPVHVASFVDAENAEADQ